MKKYIVISIIYIFSNSGQIYATGGPGGGGGDCTQFDTQGEIISCTNCTINDDTAAGDIDGDPNLEVTADGCGPVTLIIEYTFDWNQGDDFNWIHGVSFDAGPLWTNSEAGTPGGWEFMPDGVTGCCSDTDYGTGYYYDDSGESSLGESPSFYSESWLIGPWLCVATWEFDYTADGSCEEWCTMDPISTSIDPECDGLLYSDIFGGVWGGPAPNSPPANDGDPSNNWGFNCGVNPNGTQPACPTFTFELTYCPDNASPTNFMETINFTTSADGESGCWCIDADCDYSNGFEITINDACGPDATFNAPPNNYCTAVDWDLGNVSAGYDGGESGASDEWEDAIVNSPGDIPASFSYCDNIGNTDIQHTVGENDCYDGPLSESFEIWTPEIENVATNMNDKCGEFTPTLSADVVIAGTNMTWAGGGTLVWEEDGVAVSDFTVTPDPCDPASRTFTPVFETGCAACDFTGPSIIITAFPEFTENVVMNPADCGTATVEILGDDGSVCETYSVSCPDNGDMNEMFYNFVDPNSCSGPFVGTVECDCVGCTADAGSVNGSPDPLCPGSDVTVTASGYNATGDYTQMVFIADSNDEIFAVITGDEIINETLNDCGTYIIGSFNYLTLDAGDITLPANGIDYNNIGDCTVFCCQLVTSTVTVESSITSLSCPSDEVEAACQSQADINSAFNTWLGEVNGTSSCPGLTITPNTMIAPPACGGIVSVTFSAEDACMNTTTCMATFEVLTEVTLMAMCPSNESLEACSNESDILSAYTTWSTGFSNSGGCGLAIVTSGAIPTLPSYVCGEAVSLSHTYEVEDECGNTEMCTATFNVEANPDGVLMVICPSEVSLAACTSESDILSAYATWSTSFSNSGGCGTVMVTSGAVPTLPAYVCGEAVSLSHTYEVEDECGNTVMCISTFNVAENSNGALMAMCPSEVSLAACTSESDINTAYGIWSMGFSNSGGCGTVMVTSGAVPTLPTFVCGEAVSLSHTYEVEDECGNTDMCTSTFDVVANPVGALMAMCPSNEDLGFCSSEADILSVYTTWSAGFSNSGGCGAVMVTSGAIPTLPTFVCGEAVSLSHTYEAEDECGNTDMCTSTFDVAANPDGALMALCPSNEDLEACSSELDIMSAYTTWSTGFSNSGGCGTVMVTSGAVPTLPAYVCGEAVSLSHTYEVEDECGNTEMCISTFNVAENLNGALMAMCPSEVSLAACASESDINTAYGIWSMGFSNSGGCGTVMVTSGTVPTLPTFVCGEAVSLSHTYEVEDECGNTDMCTSTFDVVANPVGALVAMCPSNEDLGFCSSEADILSVYTTWSAGFSNSGGCGTVMVTSGAVPTLPTFVCGEAVSLSHTYEVEDECGNTDMCTSTFDVAANPDGVLMAMCPSNGDLEACSSESDIMSAYATWSTGFSNSGGCGTVMVTSESIPTLPSYVCGEAVSLSHTYEVEDECGNTDMCTSTFDVAANPDGVLMAMCPSNGDLEACSSESDIMTAYATWSTGFSNSGGCETVMVTSGSIPTLPSYVCGEAVSLSHTYEVEDECGNTDMCTSTFDVAANPDGVLMAMCPSNEDLEACSSESDIMSAYTTWSTGFSNSGGCGTVMVTSGSIPTLPAYVCGEAVSLSHTYEVEDECGNTDMCTSTFDVAANPDGALMAMCPSNEDLGFCSSEADILSVYTTWSAGFSNSGGCGTVMVTSGAVPTLPTFVCGEAVSLSHTYEVEDECGNTDMCTSTFDVAANPDGVLTALCASNGDLEACSSESDIMTAYATWSTGFSNSGGCGTVMVTSGAIPTLPAYVCGEAVSLSHTYEVEDECGNTDMCTSTFDVAANPDGALMVMCPSNEDLEACSSESDIMTAYATWTAGFSNSGGCGTVMVTSGAVPTLPAFVCGEAVSLSHTYEVEDECGNTDMCTSTFDVAANPDGALMVMCPSNENLEACSSESDIMSAYATWSTGFSNSGGCGTVMVTSGAIPTLPAYVCGEAVSLVHTYTAEDECGTVEICAATFDVAANPDGVLSVECPTDPILGACVDEIDIMNAYTTWTDGFSYSGGCVTVMITSGAMPTLPPYVCGEAVSLSHTYIVEDECGTEEMCTATFSVAGNPDGALMVMCPSAVSLPACSSETEINTAYATWSTGFSHSGGCGTLMVTSGAIPTLPSYVCGESVDLMHTYIVEDDCGTIEMCSATFDVIANSDGTLTVMCPSEVSLPACSSESDILLAYTTWSTGFSHSGGCGTATVTSGAVPALPAFVCGEAVDLMHTYTVEDECGTVEMCTSIFSVLANSDGVLSVLCSSDPSLPACSSESDILSAYTTWSLGFSNSGGCGSVMVTSGAIPTLPSYVCGGSVDLIHTYTVEDECGTIEMCTATFSVAANPDGTLMAICPSDISLGACTSELEINEAYTTWSLGFSNSGGCGTVTVTSGSIPTLPAYICGSEVNLSHTYTVEDECGTIEMCTAIFNVAVNLDGDLAVSCGSDPSLESCSSQIQIESAYNTWVLEFSISGGCPDANDNIISVPPLPSYVCGEGFVLNFAYMAFDGCNVSGVSCNSSFTVDASSPISIECPTNVNLPSCSTQSDIETAYNAWLTDFTFSGGCSDASDNIADIPTLPVFECGAEISIIYTYIVTDVCGMESCTSSFSVNEATATSLIVPVDITVDCQNVPEAPDAMDAMAVGDCGPFDIMYDGEIIIGDQGPCGYSIERSWALIDGCGAEITETQTIIVNPSSDPEFINPPADITLDCGEDLPTLDDLDYDNNLEDVCEILGTVSGTSMDLGSTVEYTWEFNHPCTGDLISHVQVITINPSPDLSVVDPDAICVGESFNLDDLVINDANSTGAQITFHSSTPATGANELPNNTVEPTVTTTYYILGDASGCTDEIPVELVVNENPDLSVPNNPEICEGESYDLTTLIIEDANGTGAIYTFHSDTPASIVNELSNTTVSPTVTTTYYILGDANGCTDETSVDVIVIPAPNAGDDNEADLCNVMGTTLDLNTLLSGDADLGGEWSEVTGSGQFNIITAILDASGLSGVYIFEYTVSADGCPDDVAEFTITIDEIGDPGESNVAQVCNFGELETILDLFGSLGGTPETGGIWVDEDGAGVSLGDPENVDFNGVNPGIYTFSYTISGEGVCPDTTSELEVTVNPAPSFMLITIDCDGTTTYNVIIETDGDNVMSSSGIIMDNGGGEYIISDIPIAESLTITIDNNQGCQIIQIVNPPNCDCPQVDPPVSLGDVEICEGQDIPTLEVTVNTGETVNWYDMPSGGSILTGGENTTTFTPSVSDPGVYIFYTETELIADPTCVSLILTPVTLTINENPSADNAELELCDIGDDGLEEFDLDEAINQVNSTSGLTFTYYETISDAENGINDIGPLYTINTPWNQTVFVLVLDINGCSNIAMLNLEVFESPSILIEIEDETCFGDNDGMITITASGGSPPYQYSIDGINFDTDNIFDDLSPGDYTVYILDDQECAYQEDVSIDSGVDLELTEISFECDDNGTPTDDTDDFYIITIEVSGMNTSSPDQYFIDHGSDSYGPFDYGQSSSFNLNASGQVESLTISDFNSLECSFDQNTIDLEPCSDGCELTILQSSAVCDDAGTSSDPSDDFYTITVNASAINGSAGGQFEVYVGGVLQGTFDYGLGGSFTLPADGSTVVLIYQDVDDSSCSDMVDIGMLDPCSTDCILVIEQLDFECNNNNTGTDPNDDIYTVTVNASAVNGGVNGQFEVFINGVSQGIFDYNSGGDFTIDADGTIQTVVFQDVDNGACQTSGSIGPLDPCSDDCALMILEAEIECDDNNTSTNPDDDSYTVTVDATAINGGMSGEFEIYIDGVFIDYFNYNSGGSFELPADGSSVILVFQDADDPDCNDMIDVGILDPCSTECEIIIDQLDYVCDDNGTPSDSSDDFYVVTVSASAMNGGMSGEYEVVINGVEQASYDYGTGGSFTIPADGLIQTVLFEDFDLGFCETSQDIGPLDPCSNDCLLTILQSSAVCDNAGTSSDGNDDFYNVTVNASAINGGVSGQFEVYVGGVLQGTFDYSSGGMFTLPADGLNVVLVYQDADDPNCSDMVDIGTLDPCSTDCVLTIEQLDIDCDNNGTGSDDSDDFYNVTVNASVLNGGASGQFNVLINNVLQGTYDYGVGGNFTYLANGTVQIVVFQDADNGACQSSEIIGPLDPCSNDCLLTILQSSAVCDNAGTSSDGSDDFYNVTVNASAINGGVSGQFEVYVGGVLQGTFDYSSGGMFTLPADGLNVVLVYQDADDPNCSDMVDIGTLDPCSTDCVLTIEQLDIDCDNNGTGSDDSDDFYNVTVNASVLNGGASGQFNVLINNVLQGTYDYGVGGNFTYLANGTVQIVVFQDADNGACQSSEIIGPLDPCSNDCLLTILQSSAVCDNAGTSSDGSDDFYNVTVNASAINGGVSGQFEVYVGGVLQGTFDYSSGGMFTLPADGLNVVLVYQDADDPNCGDMVDIGILDPCSTDCVLTIEQLDVDCDNNGTGSDDSDDFYNVTVNASVLNGGASGQFEVYVGGVLQGTYDYGVGGMFVLPADGSTQSVLFQDADNGACQSSEVIGPLDPCSNDCLLTILQSSSVCDNAGTSSDGSDDFYNVTVNASAINGGASGQFEVYVGGVLQGTYDYGVGGMFTLPADGLNVVLVYQDADDSNCSDMVDIGILDPCSTDCVLTIEQLDVDCDNNGTGSDNSDDFYNVTVNASVLNGGASGQFEVYVGGVLQGTYDYGVGGMFVLPADGSTQSVLFQDADNGACQSSEIIGSLDPCSNDCLLTILQSSSVCDNAGTSSDGSDDFYNVTVNASAINGGASGQFEVYVGGVLQGTYDYGVGGMFVLPADGFNVVLVYQDSDDPNCGDMINIGTLDPCSNDCLISVNNFIIGDCYDNNTGPDDTDDLYNVTINVSGTNLASGSQYEVSWNGMTWGLFDYDIDQIIDNLPANGTNLNLVITDLIAGCITNLDVSQTPCSSCDQTVDSGLDVEINCENPTVNLVTVSSEIGVSYDWEGPNSSSYSGEMITVSDSGQYCVTVTYSNMCTATDCVEVSQDPDLPIADPGEEQMITCDILTVTLDGSGSTMGPGITYEWTDENGDVIGTEATIDISEIGTYYLQVFQLECESAIQSVEVLDGTAQPQFVIYVDPSNVIDCFVDEIELSTDNLPNVVYTWITNLGEFEGDNIVVDVAGEVILNAIDTITGCTGTAQIAIEENEAYPIIFIEEPILISCYDETVIIDASASLSGSNIEHQWYDENGTLIVGETNSTISVSEPGLYIFESIDTDNGCINLDTVEVLSIIDFPDADAGVDLILNCANESLVLDGSASSSGVNIIYDWFSQDGMINNGETTVNPEVSISGEYIIEVTNIDNGCSSLDTVYVFEDPSMPIVEDLIVQGPECLGDNTASIEVIVSGGTPAYQYSLNGSPLTSNNVFENLLPGQYELLIIDANGCEIFEFIDIANPDPIELSIDGEVFIQLGESTELQGITNLSMAEIQSILWMPEDSLSCSNCLITVASPSQTTTYILMITDVFGCTETALITIHVEVDFDLDIPNIFSPNNDGENENFTIYSNNLVKKINQLNIYDRWGNLVFEGKNFEPNRPELGWDGRFNGQLVEQGVFTFIVEAELINEVVHLEYGSLTVIR